MIIFDNIIGTKRIDRRRHFQSRIPRCFTCTSVLYIRQRKYRPIYLLRAASIYSICQTLRYLSSEHICVSRTVKQMQIRQYYCASVSRRRTGRIKYLIPGWDIDRQHDRVSHKYFFTMHVLFARAREFFLSRARNGTSGNYNDWLSII